MTLRKQGRRQGVTLMELLVVLVILIGLAGIATPMLPNMLNRVHTGTASNNMVAIATCIGEYQGLYLTPYPDGWDTLLDINGAVAANVQGSNSPNAPAADLAAGGGSQMSASFATPWIQVYALNANNTAAQKTAGATDAAALSSVGINTLYAFSTTPADPTFYPYGTTPGVTPTGLNGGTLAVPVTLTAGNVAQLTPYAIGQLGLNPSGNYVIFGLGSYNSMIGRNMVNAPVHFSDDANQAPNYYYQRFGVIFKIGYTGTNGTYVSLGQASLANVVDISCDSGLAGINAHIQEFYQNANTGQ